MTRESKPYPKWVVNKDGVRVVVQTKEEHEKVVGSIEETKPVVDKSKKKSNPSSW